MTMFRPQIHIMVAMILTFCAFPTIAFCIRNEHQLEGSMNRQRLLQISVPSSLINSFSCCPRKDMIARKSASTQMPFMTDISVKLDEPILSRKRYYALRNCDNMWKSIIGNFFLEFSKAVCIAVLILFVIVSVIKGSFALLQNLKPLADFFTHGCKLSRGFFSRVLDNFRKEPVGVPMEFSDGDLNSDAWGICSLTSRKEVGRSKFVECKFELPRKDNVIDLRLGQQLTFCHLKENDTVAKGNYYLYSPRTSRGSFSILTLKNANEINSDYNGLPNFLELSIGDEIAIKPGPETLQYRGQYVPVTDMVYFVAGEGIAPVLDQVKSVLPPESSSVKMVTVVWINESEKDFDVTLSTLEKEYFKYKNKLAVSCHTVKPINDRLEGNLEIEASVPKFNPGTMAVISGPKSFANKALNFLTEIGYSEDCICVLPSN